MLFRFTGTAKHLICKQVGRKVTPQKGHEPIANLFSQIFFLAVSELENKSESSSMIYKSNYASFGLIIMPFRH